MIGIDLECADIRDIMLLMILRMVQLVYDDGDNIIVVDDYGEYTITGDVDMEDIIDDNDTVSHLWPLYIGRVSMERGWQSSS